MSEAEIGKRAAAMLQSSLRGETSRFVSHLRGEKDSLTEVRAAARYRTSVRADGQKQKYLKGIAVVMGRHGFVLHYGIEAGRLRKAHQRTRHRPRETTYRVAAHEYRRGQKAQPFIEKAIDRSRVLEFLATEITQARGEEIVTFLARGLENKV